MDHTNIFRMFGNYTFSFALYGDTLEYFKSICQQTPLTCILEKTVVSIFAKQIKMWSHQELSTTLSAPHCQEELIKGSISYLLHIGLLLSLIFHNPESFKTIPIVNKTSDAILWWSLLLLQKIDILWKRRVDIRKATTDVYLSVHVYLISWGDCTKQNL